MSRDKPRELTMPCLGRPFQLGMLYNCHTDQLIPSITLWNQEKLKQALDSKPQKSSNFEAIADNSIDTKLTKLGVDVNLKLSFLAGLVNVSGAAAYLNDQTSSENLVRVNLRYQSTAWIDQLAIAKLGDLDNPDIFTDTTATHFVSGLQYGADAIFVFDQEVSRDKKNEVHRFMKEMVELLPTISTSGNAALDISDIDKKKVQKFHCKLYCDLPLLEIPSTFEGAVKLCKDLPKLLSESDFPKMVWLCPLSQLNCKVAPITREVNTRLITQTQDFMENLHVLEMKTNDLINPEVYDCFPGIKEQLSCFKRRITEYKADFASNLAALLPKVRSGNKEDELIELFRVNDVSPFSHKCLSSWFLGKTSEVKVLGKYLESMKDFEFAFSHGDMESIVSDPKYTRVISFTFKATGKHDPFLERLNTYLQTHATDREAMAPTPWYSDPKIIYDMKVQTWLFKSFAKANEQTKETKFVVTSSSDELSGKGAVIELYDECNKEVFEPPSEPGKPSATSVTHNSIQVNWSKPKSGAQNVQFYTVFYRDLSCSPEQWKAEKISGTEDSTTVNDLDAQKKYCFKVQAVCKAGFSLDSKISDPIQTKLLSIAPGIPTVSSVSHNSIQLQWTKPQYGEFNVEVYTISYHEIKDPPEPESHWKKVQSEGTKQSTTISDLTPQTAYSFKVHAKFKTIGDTVSLASDVSDPIQTYPVPVPPGKPIASNVTHNTVQLEWSEPQYGGHHIEFYTIFYHELKDPPELEEWKQTKTTNDNALTIVSNMAAETTYSFKVRAEFSAGINLVSEISEPVKTKLPPVPPGKPIISCVTHNSLHLEWSKPQYNEENVELYTMFCHKVKNSEDQEQTWKEVETESLIYKESVTVSSLIPQTDYSFKVHAKFTSGMLLISETSDPIQTYPIPVPPGKPIASDVTHNSVQLKWSKPQYGTQNVELYTVFYHEIKYPPSSEQQWMELKTKGATESATLTDLAAQTQYSIKVHAKFKTGTSLISEISDPIQTYPTPGPPGKPIASNVTHNSIQLAWSEPRYGGQPVESYTVLYRETKDPPQLQWKEVRVDNTKQSITVGKLAVQTVYSFRVQAQFKACHTCSDVSDPIKTHPHPIPPSKPFASGMTYNSIQLEWSKAQCAGQTIDFYTICYREIKDPQHLDPQWKELRTEGATESAVLSELTAQTQYSVKICAKFKTGTSLASDISDPIQTYPVPVPPGKPIASNVTHNTVQLEWSAPQYGEQSIEFYTVLYSEIEDPPNQEQWKDIRLDSLKQSIIVDHLASSTVYSFKVHAQFKAGIVCSETSDPVQTHPHPIPPGRPFTSAVTFNSFQLEWSKAQFSGQNIESYTVFYHEIKYPQNLEPQWQQFKVQGVIESTKLSDLAAQTQYSVKVQAKSETGMSLFSHISDPIQTYPVPVPPGKPIASDAHVTHNSIQLEWSEPQYGGQSVEFYTVLYCEIKDPLKQWKELRLDNIKPSARLDNLASQTVYSFKVHAQFKAGIVCSEISNPVQTHPPPLPPGKPFASTVTYNTIKLKWTKAQYGGQDAELYSVFYQESKDPPEQWGEIKSSKEVITISHLTAKTYYSFKVCADFKTGKQIVSEISDPIQTYSFPVLPGKPTASNVTHNSITLEWSEAHYGAANCKSYIVSYYDALFGQCKEIKTSTSSVMVGNLIPQTEYSFKITAEFRSGMPLASGTSDLIKTYPVPVSPGKPFASNVTRDSLQLEWSIAQYGGENAKSYTVFFCRFNDPTNQWKELNVDHPLRKESSIPIQGMDPKTKYNFRIRANFKAGNTLLSEISDPLQTVCPVPPGKPIASKVIHSDIHLEWSEAYYGELKVQSYTVLYRMNTPDPSEQWRRLTTSKPSIIVSHLNAQTVYYFKVCAELKNGNTLASSLSEPIKTTPLPVRPGKPAVSDITHDSVQLSWSKAHYGEHNVECYTVISSEIRDPPAHDQKVTETPNTSVTIRHLTAEAKYSFKVYAKFKAGITLDSDPSGPIQMNPFPEHPGRLTVSNITHNSVQLEWSKAHYGEYKIECYSVFPYELKSQKQGEETKALKTSVIVTGLNAETKYSFKVYAEVAAAFRHGVILASDFSDPIQTSPLPKHPGRPIVSNVTYNSVRLEWSKAHYGEHKIESYTVLSCKTNDTATQKSWKEIKTLNTSITVSDLTAETKYSFKVQANFKPCIILDSEFSDTIQTNPFPQPPGKPTACSMTHDSIELRFSRAQYGAQKVELYKIFYRRIKDSRTMEPWREATSTTTDVTIGGLIPQTIYSFKVDAKLPDGTILCSEMSDPIQTHPLPLPPGKPSASSRTHNSIQLEWSKPQYEGRVFLFYTVFYRKFKGPWKEVKLDNPICKESVLISDLTPKTEYSFKVHAKFKFGDLNSGASDPICTHPASVIPGKPYPFSVTHNSIQLQWPRPVYGAEYIEFYTVLYREMKGPPSSGNWKERKSRGAIESITISGLGAKKKYSIKIRAEIKPCGLSKGTSAISDPIKTKDRIALQMLSKTPTNEGPLELHKLSMVKQMTDETNRIKRCFVGKQPSCLPAEHKVLLVVGATGAGKSTLINGMINYILGVEWKDAFRFKLITEEVQHTQAKSQTKWITAYSLPEMEGSPVPYTLTIIDTPGFGDTEGLERDRTITKQIKEFFSMGPPHGIDHINGIGFVTQSALARLTPTQQYIFNAILAIFGKDVAENIFMMVTFADGQSPPVMAAIKAADIPCCKFYKFNNSALFASNDVDEADEGDPEADNFDRMFWKMGFLSFKQFFTDFYKARPASLVLTKEVLEERERLDTTISGLQPQIRSGLAKIEEMRQEEEVLQKHEAEIATNKDFTYVVELTKQRKIDLKGQGVHVTNCLRCNFTCHKECWIPKDEDKHKCSAMGKDGLCTVCTKKCKWDQHVNNPFRFEDYVVEETRTSEDLKKKFAQAVVGKTLKESMMSGIDSQLKDVHTEVLTMIKQVQRCLHRLDEIALKPNPLAEVDFLDLLIESEKQQAKPGWLHRVRYYESAKDQAVILQHLQTEEVIADLDSAQESETPNLSWYDRFRYWFGLSP